MEVAAFHAFAERVGPEFTARADAYALEDGSYRLVASAQDDESFSAPPSPDLEIRLSDLWDW